MLAVLLHTENMIQLLKKCTYPYYNTKIKKMLSLLKSSFVGLGKFEIELNESKMLSKKRVHNYLIQIFV